MVMKVRLSGPIAFVCTVALAGCGGGAGTSSQPTTSIIRAVPKPTARLPSVPPRLTAETTRSQLPVPVSRAVVLTDNGSILIAGGVDQTGESTSGVFRLAAGSSKVSRSGTLSDPTHDAAGAILHGRMFVFGGGTANSSAAVQGFTVAGGGGIAGQLPRPRSDLTSAMSQNHAYLVGGYDGSILDPQVLVTDDGIHFRVVAKLLVSVRYGAVAALSGHLFVFGGQTANGDTAAIQEIDLRSGRVRLAGRLPLSLSHASAVKLRKYIYILGGISGGSTRNQIWSFDPVSGRVSAAGFLPTPLSDTGATTVGETVYIIGGENAGTPTRSLIRLRLSSQSRKATAATFPFNGKLLIADRGNNRLILVDANKRVLWSYPSAKVPPPTGGFYYPDDAFFAAHGKRIIVNEEGNQVVIEIAFPSGRLVWQYGHPGIYGGLNGYLHEPDDAYILRNGQVVVADDQNCRILFISPSGSILHQLGTTGLCAHQPPSALGSPNGDTPLIDGNILISEINGSWIDEYTPNGKLIWAVQLPISYPSDPQQIGSNEYLVADYATPGGIYEFSRTGRILWSYRVPAGPGMLDHPSLAERLPNGLIAACDDYRHRVVLIDPVKHAIVWQYGQTDNIGMGASFLNTPDGFDLLSPHNRTPTHPATR